MDEQQNQLTMPVYHGTQNDITAFNDKIPPERSSDEWENRDQNYHSMSRALGVHVAKDPVVSNSEYFTMRNLSSVGANVMPLVTHNEDKFFKIDQSRDGSGEFDPTKIDQLKHDDYAVDREILKVAYRKDPKMLAEELENQRGYSPEESKVAAGNILSGKGHIEGSGTEARPIRDLNHLITGWGMKPYNPDNRYKALKLFRDELESQGFKGVKYINTSPSEIKGASDPTCYIVFRPNELRSKFAKFDPARRHEADLTAANGGVMDDDGITAYHGSPHDFDEFDTSKIGTGEGAQSYGHGLYFAGHEPVAKEYRDRLAKEEASSGETIADQHVIAPHFYKDMSDQEIAEHMDEAASWADKKIFDQGKMKYLYDDGSMLIHDEDRVRAVQKQSGHMYEVHINAHPHHMLDWDKDVSEQHPHVLDAINKLIPKDEEHRGGLQEFVANPDDYAGGAIIDYLHSAYGTKKTSEMLHSAGIKGIKYLDAGSRSDKSKQTHNYVVFDHNDVRVKRKYERGGRVRFSQGGTDSYDYRGEHQAPGPEGGAPLHDLTKVYPDDVYGPNGFQYYGETGDPSDRANFSLVQSMRGKPNAPVTMYRAVPNVPSVAKELAKLEEDMANYQRRGRLPRDAWTTDKTRWYDSSAHQRDLLREKAEKEKLNPPAEIGINAGDWVTTNRQYAKDHGESALNGNYKILTKKARAKELFTAGDSHHEWGYHPEKKAEGGEVDGYEDGGEIDDHYIGEHYQDGGEVDPPKKKVKAYKLFRTDPKKPGKLFPLFVDANTPVPIKKWVEAKAGDPGKDPTKVKSKLGDLAYRPGWHAGDLPVATHIGGKSSSDLKAPDYRPDNHVWAEIEMPNDVDWQSEANSRVQYTKAGKPKPATAHITDQVPLGGHYRYKTNPNMTGNWLIGGSMKVNRILKDDEVKAINDANGVADLPRLPRAPETKARGGPVATSGPIVKRALELLSKDRTGR
jgi:hypothetical protein